MEMAEVKNDEETRRRQLNEDSDVSQVSDDENIKDLSSQLNDSNSSKEAVEPEPAAVVADHEPEYESCEERASSEVGHDNDGSQGEAYYSEEGGREDMAQLLDGDELDDRDWEDEEREDGDGEESEVAQSKEKPLDFDEDRRNPQYIPKKGGFYEHDDRLGEEEEAAEEQEEQQKKVKKLWKNDGLWEHDRFLTDEQNPKSRDELVSIYGYDIRNEDGPPRARRRRRYGRGPSKYTRNWEDENAYAKASLRRGADESNGDENFRGGFRGRRGRGSSYSGRGRGRGGPRNEDEFYRQQSDSDSYRKEEEEQVDNKSNRDEMNEFPPLPSNANDRTVFEVDSKKEDVVKDVQESSKGSVVRTNGKVNRASRRNYSNFPRSRGGMTRQDHDGVNALMKDVENLTVSSRERRFVPNTPPREGRKEAKVLPTQHNFDGHPPSIQHERRQATVPPRLQDSMASRPKRYSSQRQRQGADPVSYQQSAGLPQSNSSMPPRFYESSYQQAVYAEPGPPPPPPPSTQGNAHQGSAQIISQHYQGYDPSSYQETYAIRPLANPPRMFNPVSLATGQPVIPAPYIAPGGNIMNYGPPPAAYTQYQFQQYAPTAPPVSQPQEIFRCGMAYYNAPPPPVRTLPKRPRAAIPIVPPPELEEQRRDDSEECSESIDARSSYSPEHTVTVNN